MNIIGIGIDLSKNKRIEKLYIKYKNKFIKKILNNDELHCFNITKNKIRFLCKSFTIKEAIIKAMGTGFKLNLTFNSIKINKNKLGKPIIKINSNYIINKNIKIFTSISHELKMTIAIAIIFI